VTKDRDPYSRYYWRFADEYPAVYADDHLFAAWGRLLMQADGVYPASAPIPRWIKQSVLKRLVEEGVVVLTAGDRYRIRGQVKERETRHAEAVAGGLKRAATAQRDASGRWMTGLDERAGEAPPASTHNTTQNNTTQHIRELAMPNGDDEGDELTDYYDLTQRYPNKESVKQWLGRLRQDYGRAPLREALATEFTLDSATHTLLSRTDARLARAKDTAQRAAGKQRDKARTGRFTVIGESNA
jgi:hypothetical protein